MLFLGIETSCDDTATALVRDGRRVLASVSTDQDAFHAKYGGIVPEIASRRHTALLSAAIEDALGRAQAPLESVDGIAVTCGPGLIGSLAVGVASAKALAFATGKPLYGVNHLHGHVFAAFLGDGEKPQFPFLALLVSGGHSQLVAVRSATSMTIVGRTKDDAAGEAYDKTARLLGLPYPGGPAIDQLARNGNPQAYAFPRHRPGRGSLDLSFSGLKTSVRYFLESAQGAHARPEDVAASFQAAVVDVLVARIDAAFFILDESYETAPCHPELTPRSGKQQKYTSVVLAGGVAANSALQRALRDWGERKGVRIFIPELRYCTDNAAMIAAAAFYQGDALRADALTLTANPNLPFEIAFGSHETGAFAATTFPSALRRN